MLEDIEQYVFEPDEKEVSFVITRISSLIQEVSNERSQFIFGYGKQRKSTYINLQEKGFGVVWIGIKAPAWVRFLSFAIASYSGLIKVEILNNIELPIKQLGHLGMVGFFSISRNKEEAFVAAIANNRNIDPEDYLKEHDPSFFGFILDGDNNETESGQLAIIQHGPECPENLKSIVNNFGEFGYLGRKKMFES